MGNHNCIDCEAPITNPICSSCLARQMQLSLGADDATLSDTFVDVPIAGDVHCLFCQTPIGLCASCYSRDMYELLQEKNPLVGKQFLKLFDFDLRKSLSG